MTNRIPGGLIALLSCAGLCAQTVPPPDPITPKQRVVWIVDGTIGPASLAAGLVSAGLGTLQNSPEEYGPHWEGFGKRYGIRMTGIATNRTIEAGLGSLWGEDPRYRALGSGEPMKNRLKHVLKWTFVADNANGSVQPAYARYVAWGGGSFLSSTWRPDSDADIKAGVERVYLGVLLRMASNAVREFSPDLRRGRARPQSLPAASAPGKP